MTRIFSSGLTIEGSLGGGLAAQFVPAVNGATLSPNTLYMAEDGVDSVTFPAAADTNPGDFLGIQTARSKGDLENEFQGNLNITVDTSIEIEGTYYRGNGLNFGGFLVWYYNGTGWQSTATIFEENPNSFTLMSSVGSLTRSMFSGWDGQGTLQLIVEMHGGGGSGASLRSGGPIASGGGSGARVRFVTEPLTESQLIATAVNVGSGGPRTTSISFPANGVAGGASTFTTGGTQLASAGGGGGGIGANILTRASAGVATVLSSSPLIDRVIFSDDGFGFGDSPLFSEGDGPVSTTGSRVAYPGAASWRADGGDAADRGLRDPDGSLSSGGGGGITNSTTTQAVGGAGGAGIVIITWAQVS